LVNELEKVQSGRKPDIVVKDIEYFNVSTGLSPEESKAGKIGGYAVCKITTDSGITGYSFGFGYNQKQVQLVKELLVGKDPFELDSIYQLFSKNQIVNNRLGGWEHALWDVIGKACGLPVHKLLGGPYRDKVKLYITVCWPSEDGIFHYYDDQSRIPFEKKAEDLFFLKKHGYLAAKIRCWCKNIMDDVEALKHIKRAVGNDFLVLYDRTSEYPGWVWTYEQALQVARGFEENGAYWLEDPFESDETCMAKSARLREAVGLLITGNLNCKVDDISIIAKYFAEQAFDVYNPWPDYNGILFCHKIGMLAQAFNTQMIPHAGHGLDLAGYLQLDAASPTTDWQEYFIIGRNMLPQEEWEPSMNLLHNKDFLNVENGQLSIPQGPGLGLDVDEDALEHYRIK